MQYELGLGEASRGLYRAIHTSDIPITPFAPPITLNAPITVDFNKKILGRNLTHELTVFHLNPPEMEHIRKFWPRALNSYQYTVGYWYFELPKLPNSWIAGFHGLKEIWVATRFVYDTVNRNSPIPVYIIPPLVQVSDPGFVNKSEFGLPQNSVCVLFTFDLNSYKTRKNPDASIAAFRLAVKSTPDLHLILKINNADKNWGAMSEIQNLLLGINSFTIITEVYSRKTLTRLQAACDIFLSLHRSEGFGLNLAECMALGKPVVATGWSGNMDFMNEQNSCPVKYTLVELNETYGPYEQGQTWAEPSIEDAAEKLINLANSENLRIEIGQKARATIESNYSAAIVSDAVRKRITTIQKSAANETTTPC